MAQSKAVILKIFSLAILFIATVVGCHAHFESKWSSNRCSVIGSLAQGNCPSGASSMEKVFVGLTIFCLILSTLSLVANFLMDFSRLKVRDAGYHGLAGVLILLSGILMIVAAVQIDNFVAKLLQVGVGGVHLRDRAFRDRLEPTVSAAQEGSRKSMKYFNKIAAGFLAVINGLLYFVTAAVIYRSKLK